MAKKQTITIDDDLYKSLSDYCELNNLKINQYCNQLLRDSFMIDKYGDIPFGTFSQDDITETNNIDETNITDNITEDITEIKNIQIINSLVTDKTDNKTNTNKKRRL